MLNRPLTRDGRQHSSQKHWDNTNKANICPLPLISRVLVIGLPPFPLAGGGHIVILLPQPLPAAAPE